MGLAFRLPGDANDHGLITKAAEVDSVSEYAIVSKAASHLVIDSVDNLLREIRMASVQRE